MMNIEEARNTINTIDSQIIALFSSRMEAVKAIAQQKEQSGKNVLDQAREREVLSRIAAQAGDTLEPYAKLLYQTMLSVSKAYQQTLINKKSTVLSTVEEACTKTQMNFPSRATVAVQGVEGAYSEKAATKLFSLPSILYFRHFEGVFQAVDQGLCQYGVLPIDNSSYGSVGQVYDLMKTHRFFIARSMKLCIHHCLLAKPGVPLSQIREIYSHEQAIGQCSHFLKELTNITVHPCENTAVAAKLVAESDRDDIAAISSLDCAKIYGLSVLSDQVQNNENNYTRFICISKSMELYAGANKVSLILSAEHSPGALFLLISKFSALGINLTKLESRPIPGSNFEFLFYLDMEASILDKNFLAVLKDLEQSLDCFVFLGNYLEVS